MSITTRLLQTGIAGTGALFAAATAQAQDSTVKVPVMQVAPVEARSARALGAVSSLRALPDGSVFINDASRRQLLRFDATLQDVRVIADTMPGSPLPYSQRTQGLLPYAGDSTIIVDPTTSALVVLNKDGKVSRIMASPRNNDINLLSTANLGSNAFDTNGQLVYRQGSAGGGPPIGAMFGSGNPGGGRGGQPGQPAQSNTRGGATGGAAGAPAAQGARGGDAGGGRGGDTGGGVGGAGGFGGGPGGGRGFNPANQPDSVPIVRVNFDTRKADSVAWVKVPKNETSMTRSADGSTRMTAKINPLPQGDDWALLSDGTIAVIRVLDYHVDFFTTDGKRESSPRLPFDWKRISDDDKIKLVDSLKSMAKALLDRQAAAAGNNARGGFQMNFEVTSPEKLPDYYPPIRAGSSIADLDGNVWILPTTSNLSAQLAQQMMQGGGRGGFGGGFGGGGRGGAPGDSTRRGAAPGDSTGRGGFGGMPPGLMPVSAPLVYDVVNRKGELVHRVQLPAGRQIVGFGKGGVIYVASREGMAREIFLEKTRLVN